MKAKKKLSAFIIAVILMLNIIPVVSADNEDGTFNMLSEFYMPGGDGVGFYDTATVDSPMEKKPEYWGHGGIILRPGEWIKYELPNNMKEGTYTLYLNMANYNPNQVSIYINDSYGYHYVNIPESKGPDGEFDGSLMYYTQREIGDVFIGEGTNTLTVKACKDAFTLLDFTLVYKNNDKIYNIAHTNLYSCLNKGASGTENSTNPEIGYISGSGIDILPNKMLVMRPKSQFTFDISNFSQGTYNLSVKSASLQTQKVDLILSENADGTGNKSTTEAMLLSTGDWNSYARTVVLDEIFVAEDMNYLTIDVQSGASQLDYLIFEKISDRCKRHEIRYDEVTSDIAGEGFYAGKVDGVVRESFEAPINSTGTNKTSAGMRQGYYMEYDIVNLPEDTYKLSIVGATYLADTAVDIYLNNELIKENAVLEKTGGHSELLNYTEINVPCAITLGKGVNKVKIKASSSAFNLRAVVLSAEEMTMPSVTVYANGEKTTEVAEGTMKAVASLGDSYDREETMLVFVIYRKDKNDIEQIYKLAMEKSALLTDFMAEIEEIEFEEGYSYFYKVFLLKASNFSSYLQY